MTAAVLLAHAPASMAEPATVAAPSSLAAVEPSQTPSAELGGAGVDAGAVEGAGAGGEAPDANGAPPAGDPKPIVVTAQPGARQDPLAAVNIQTYKAVQAVDSAVVLPVALGYKNVLPRTVRTGLRNILLNLTEPVVFVNYVLQLQPKRAAQVVGRFAINSTVGIGGVLDVAKKKPFHLPHHTNGFAYTLGYYGVPSGPYLFLPLIGPTTLRDMFGRVLDQSMIPATVGFPFTGLTYSIPTGAINALDFRVEADSALKKLHDADNPYGATRADYLARRKRDIAALRGPNHAIPIQDDTVPGATISAANPAAAAKPSAAATAPVVAPVASPASANPATSTPPVRQTIVLTPAAPPSTKPRP
ncbi:VacJ family lipoprotein [Novosphingobium sp.]|uniref:MlaA family lipoprotein n=1 Tax=Novosphingobium sp. TaxID=1874826 RepID=UPI0025DD364A|nr:VacJ family lipoprotein [Novosphingobium sp.]